MAVCRRTSSSSMRSAPKARAQSLALARSLPRMAVLVWLWFALAVALMGLGLVSGSQAQDLNSLINDTPSATSGGTAASNAGHQNQTPPSNTQNTPTTPTYPQSSQQAGNATPNTAPSDQGQADAGLEGEQESFTPANRCPRCALFSAVQKADAGSTCQAVIFQGAPSYSVTGDFETSDTLEVTASDSCRLSFFNDSPNRSIVLKLDRALRDLILAPSPDLYSGYLLAPRSSIDLIIRSSQLARSIDAKNIVTWEDAAQVGTAEDSLFTIRVTPN